MKSVSENQQIIILASEGKLETLVIGFENRFTNSEPQDCSLYMVNGNKVPISRIRIIPRDAYPNKNKIQMRNVIFYLGGVAFTGVMKDDEYHRGGEEVIYLKPFYDNIYCPTLNT